MPRYGFEIADAPAFSQGNQTSVALRKRNLLSQLVLRVTGTYTITGGAGGSVYFSDAIWRLVRSITVQSSGNSVQTVSGQALRLLDKFWSWETRTQTQPTNVAAGSSGSLELFLPIPQSMLHSFQPEGFAFPTYHAQAPTLFVNWGMPADFLSTADGTPSFSNMAVELYEIPMQGVPLQPATRFAPLMIFTHEVPIVQSQNGAKLYLDTLVHRMEARAVLLEAFAGGASGAKYAYSDSVLTRVSLNVNGQYQLDKVPFGVQQDRNRGIYGLTARETGVVMIDSAEDQRTNPGDLYTILGDQRPFIEYDATKQAGDNLLRATVVATANRPLPF